MTPQACTRRLLFVAVTLLAMAPEVVHGQERPFRIDDEFEIEAFGAFSHAPDGRAMAFTRRRPANSQVTNALLIPQTRDDVWVQDGPDGEPKNLTNGASDASGWWAPMWSPQGTWLAMLSTRGGHVRVWGWERATGTLRQMAAVDVEFDYLNVGAHDRACQWVDDRRLLCVTMPAGKAATPMGAGQARGRGVEQAEAAWARAQRGEMTASEVDSLAFSVPAHLLTLIDFADGTARKVADVQSHPHFARARTHWLSPRSGLVALIRPDFVSPFAENVRYLMGYPAQIELRTLDGKPFDLAGRGLPDNIVTRSIQWSPDGTAMTFFALQDRHVHPSLIYGEAAGSVRYPSVATRDYPGRLFRVDLATKRVEVVATADIDLGQKALPPSYLWLPSGELVFNVTRLSDRAVPGKAAAPQWTVLQRDGRTRPLASEPKPAAYRLVATEELANGSTIATVDGRAALLALANSDLWRIDPASGSMTNLTATLAAEVVAVARVDRDGQSASIVITAGTPKTEQDRRNLSNINGGVSGVATGFAEQHVLDTRSGALTPLRKPHKDAVLESVAVASSDVVYSGKNRSGSFVWRAAGGGEAKPIAAANQFWAHIQKPAERIIEYQGFNGQTLRAKLTLPPNYQLGKRYPIVVDSDIDYTSTAAWARYQFTLSDPEAALFADHFDAQAFASAGYIYMWASMPTTTPADDVRNNLLRVSHGLVPAVDAAVAQGYADPERVFVYGVSSMGLGVYGIVTQTSRFTAAAGAFGWVDNAGQTLSIDIVRRYSDTPFVRGDFAVQYIGDPIRVWRDGDVLRRNSPLSYVDRVETPLLIIDSDFDAGWMENTEQFFTALVQQRKPAKFVRYFGEGHGTRTPANTLDYYQRIFAWFDQWGAVARDSRGAMIFTGDRVLRRTGAPPLRSTDYAAFDVFRRNDAARGASR